MLIATSCAAVGRVLPRAVRVIHADDRDPFGLAEVGIVDLAGDQIRDQRAGIRRRVFRDRGEIVGAGQRRGGVAGCGDDGGGDWCWNVPSTRSIVKPVVTVPPGTLDDLSAGTRGPQTPAWAWARVPLKVYVPAATFDVQADRRSRR